MNYFQQLFDQGKSLLASMTPAAKLMAGLMITLIVVSSGFLVQGTQTTRMELLFAGHTFKDSDLQQAEMALSSAGLRLYERDGNRLRIPTNQKDLYLKALSEGNAVPKDLGSSVQSALSGGNFLEPMFTTKSRVLTARQRDISDAIARLPFVEHAYVTYDERREGFSAQSQSTASVYVLPRHGTSLTDQQKRNIARQVQAGFAGLKYEDISVMDQSNSQLLAGDTDPMNAQQQIYYLQKQQAEQDLRRKAMNLLGDYGDVRLEVNVELDPTLREETETLKFADKPVTISTTTTKKDSESTKAATGGRPGTEPNALANRSASLSNSGDQSNKSKEQMETERKIVGKETILTARAGLVIRNASLSVAIPNSFYSSTFRRQWLEQNPTKQSTETPSLASTEYTQFKSEIKDKVQTALTAILPTVTGGTNPLPRVTVTDYHDVPVEPLPSPSLAEGVGGWVASQWQVVAMLVLAVVALVMLRSFVNGGAPRDDSAFDRGFDIPLDDLSNLDISSLLDSPGGVAIEGATGSGEAGSGAVNADGSPVEGSGRRFPKASSNNIRNELSDMVRDNPDAAAALLKSWIGEAA